MNVFSSVVDALDKDPELVAIKKIVAEGECRQAFKSSLFWLG